MNTPYSCLGNLSALPFIGKGQGASETVFVLRSAYFEPFMRRFRERRFTLL